MIITVQNTKFNLDFDGFNRFEAERSQVESLIYKALSIADVQTLSEEDLVSIGDRACREATAGWHDANAVSVVLSRQ